MSKLSEEINSITDRLGELVRQQVQLEELIPMLASKLQGAQHPEDSGAYHSSLNEARGKLTIVKIDLIATRQHMIGLYERRIHVLNMEIENCIDAWDIDEMKAIQNHLSDKIEHLKELNRTAL